MGAAGSMTLEDLRTELLDNINVMLSALEEHNKQTEDQDFIDEYEFWFDPGAILYDSDPSTACIDSAGLDDIDLADDDYLSKFLTKDIINTYLSSGELALVVASSEIDNEVASLVAAVDRSTGVALFSLDNLFDPEYLDGAASIATRNSVVEDKQPITRGYKLSKHNDSQISDLVQNNSRRRLLSLLQDIDMHVLSRHIGKEVKAIDYL
jgi:hypothetical protein